MDSTVFVAAWQDAWNSHDLDAILIHYRDDVVFRSTKAIPITGAGEVRGRAALRRYWAAALDRQPDLRFEVQDIFDGHEMLAITYRNQHGVLAIETLHFDSDGMIHQASACHRRVTV